MYWPEPSAGIITLYGKGTVRPSVLKTRWDSSEGVHTRELKRSENLSGYITKTISEHGTSLCVPSRL